MLSVWRRLKLLLTHSPGGASHNPIPTRRPQVFSAFREALGADAAASAHLLGDTQDATAALLAACRTGIIAERPWFERKVADLALSAGANGASVGWPHLPSGQGQAIAKRLRLLDNLCDVVELFAGAVRFSAVWLCLLLFRTARYLIWTKPLRAAALALRQIGVACPHNNG